MLPCDPSEFYLLEVGGGYWWVQGLGETARVWILDVGGRRVAFLAHAYPGSSANAKADFEKILTPSYLSAGPSGSCGRPGRGSRPGRLASPAGFEPATFRLEGGCSVH